MYLDFFIFKTNTVNIINKKIKILKYIVINNQFKIILNINLNIWL